MVQGKRTMLGNIGIDTTGASDKFSIGEKVLMSDSTNPGKSEQDAKSGYSLIENVVDK